MTQPLHELIQPEPDIEHNVESCPEHADPNRACYCLCHENNRYHNSSNCGELRDAYNCANGDWCACGCHSYDNQAAWARGPACTYCGQIEWQFGISCYHYSIRTSNNPTWECDPEAHDRDGEYRISCNNCGRDCPTMRQQNYLIEQYL